MAAGSGGLPNRRRSLKARHDGTQVWAALRVTKKLYFCLSCKGRIEIGQEAVVLRYRETANGIRTNHFLYHPPCFNEEILPHLKGVEEISPQEAEKGKISKKVRKARQNQRRRARKSH